MKKFETPQLCLVTSPEYLRGAVEVIVTLRALSWLAEFSMSSGSVSVDSEAGEISVQLTQKDTEGAPEDYNAKGQVSIIYNDNKRIVSDPFSLRIEWTAHDKPVEV